MRLKVKKNHFTPGINVKSNIWYLNLSILKPDFSIAIIEWNMCRLPL